MARVGVPSFSVGEGLKFKGHDEAWGEAQAKDYVDHHYHQPSDEFEPEWDFSGLARMTRFGYVLGQKAANAPNLQGWQPGDEFETARKKAAAAATVGPNLFSMLPGLRVCVCRAGEISATRAADAILGTVAVHVKVDAAGSVIGVAEIPADAQRSGLHDLLATEATSNVAKWKFEPLPNGPVEFELHYDFIMLSTDEGGPRARSWNLPNRSTFASRESRSK